MKKLLSFLAIAVTLNLSAQNISANANFNTIYPTEEFKENTGNVFVGYGAQIKLHQIGLPFIGYTISYNQYDLGHENYNSAIAIGDNVQNAELHMRTKITNVAAGIEMKIPNINVTPIIGGRVGGNFFHTKKFHVTEIGIPQENGQYSYTDQRVGESNSINGSNLTAEWYTGIQWSLTRAVNLGATFGKTYSTQASYEVLENPIRSYDGKARSIQKKSNTNFFQGAIRFGVTF